MLGRQTRGLRLSRDHGLSSHSYSYQYKAVYLSLQHASKCHVFKTQAPSFLGVADLRQLFGYTIFEIEVFRGRKWVIRVKIRQDTAPQVVFPMGLADLLLPNLRIVDIPVEEYMVKSASTDIVHIICVKKTTHVGHSYSIQIQ